MHVRSPLAWLLWLGLGSSLAAQTPADWLKQPYQLQIFIHAEPHPLLTKEFLGRLEREVRDTLQRDLGKTAVVAAVAESSREPRKLHPLMKEVVRDGWDALDKPSYPITGAKVHLVRLRYEDGEYLLESRQVDGDTGIVSPLRRQRTSDRLWVSRLAALMIGQDFGLTAEVVESTEQTVVFQLRAANLGQAESIQVRDNEVFALSRILRAGSGLQGRREEYALLFVTGVNPATGRCTGRLFTRYKQPLKKDPRDRATAGFRAIKLGTLRTPLQVKVIDAKTNDAVAGCEVLLYPGGFPNQNEVTRAPLKLGATDSSGRISTSDPVPHVAFVRFQRGPVGVDIPIALFDDQPVTVRLTGIQEADRLAEFMFFYRQWERQLGECYSNVQGEYEEISKLKQQKKDGDALDRMEKLAAKVKEDAADLGEKLTRLRELAAPAGDSANRLVKASDENLAKVVEVAEKLTKMAEDERNPSPARKAFTQGQIAEENLKFEDAIRFYAESLKLDANQPILKRKLDTLRRIWLIRNNPAHQAARDFFVKTWPELGWRDVRSRFEEAEKHLRELEKVGDFLTARLFLRANLAHIEKVQALLTQLTSSTSEEDQTKAEEVEGLLDQLRLLNKDLLDFIAKASPK